MKISVFSFKQLAPIGIGRFGCPPNALGPSKYFHHVRVPINLVSLEFRIYGHQNMLISIFTFLHYVFFNKWY